MGDTMELLVSTNSDNQSVVGYDVMLSYDATKLQFKESASLDPSFNMFTFTKKGKSESDWSQTGETCRFNRHV